MQSSRSAIGRLETGAVSNDFDMLACIDGAESSKIEQRGAELRKFERFLEEKVRINTAIAAAGCMRSTLSVLTSASSSYMYVS